MLNLYVTKHDNTGIKFPTTDFAFTLQAVLLCKLPAFEPKLKEQTLFGNPFLVV
jgi:hypothetical protein